MVPPPSDGHTRGLASFSQVLKLPGAAAFTSIGIVARLPISMIGLGIVFLVTSRDPSYALAGGLAAAFALAAALIGPFGSRFVDRLGQRRVLPVLAGGQTLCLLVLVAGLNRGWPLAWLLLVAVAAGGIGPNIGSLVRARWIALLTGDPRLRTAFALESIADEVVFILGPLLATALALGRSPEAPLLVCAVLVGVGSLALSRQRRTEPIPRPVLDNKPRGHAMLLPGMPQLVLLMLLLGAVFGSFEVTTVAFAASQGAPQATGVLLAMYAAGSLIGGVLLGTIRPAGTLTGQLRWAAALLAVISAPMPLAPSVGVLALLALAAGFAVAPVLILATSLLEVLVAAGRITEALTVSTSGIAVGLALAAPLAGYLIDTRSPTAGYVLMAAAAIGVLAVMLAAHGRLLRLELQREALR